MPPPNTTPPSSPKRKPEPLRSPAKRRVASGDGGSASSGDGAAAASGAPATGADEVSGGGSAPPARELDAGGHDHEGGGGSGGALPARELAGGGDAPAAHAGRHVDTAEQAAILETARGAIAQRAAADAGAYRGRIVVVTAAAGSGKTTTSQHVAAQYAAAGLRVLYMVFNKSAQVEMQARMHALRVEPLHVQDSARRRTRHARLQDNVEVRTMHSAAARFCDGNRAAGGGDADLTTTILKDAELSQKLDEFLQNEELCDGATCLSQRDGKPKQAKRRLAARFIGKTLTQWLQSDASEEQLFPTRQGLTEEYWDQKTGSQRSSSGCKSYMYEHGEPYLVISGRDFPHFQPDWYPAKLNSGEEDAFGKDFCFESACCFRAQARQVWDRMKLSLEDQAGSLPWTHDASVKYAQLSGLHLREAGFDCIIMDESQDATAAQVAMCVSDLYLPLELSSRKHEDLTGEKMDCSAPQIDCYIVGDAAQAIYQFRGGNARNAMRLSNQEERHHPEPDVSLSLTQSFRFGASVALEANRLLLIKKKSMGVVSWTPYSVRVDEEKQDRVLPRGEAWAAGTKRTVLAFGNGTLVSYAIRSLSAAQGLTFEVQQNQVGKFKGILQKCRLIADMAVGSPNPARPLPEGLDEFDFESFFEKSSKKESGLTNYLSPMEIVKQYIMMKAEVAPIDGQAQQVVFSDQLLQPQELAAGCERLEHDLRMFEEQVLQRPAAEADVMLSTVHTAKGGEWDNVEVLGDQSDLPQAFGDYELIDAAEKAEARSHGFFGRGYGKKTHQGFIIDPKTKDKADLNLIYVAITRAKKQLMLPEQWWEFVQPGHEEIRGCRMFLRLCKEKKHAERCAMRCNQFHRRPDREVDEGFWSREFAVKCSVRRCGGSWPMCQFLQHTDLAARRAHEQNEEEPLQSQAGTDVDDGDAEQILEEM